MLVNSTALLHLLLAQTANLHQGY